MTKVQGLPCGPNMGGVGAVSHKGQCTRGRRTLPGPCSALDGRHCGMWPRGRWVSPRPGPAVGSWGGLQPVTPQAWARRPRAERVAAAGRASPALFPRPRTSLPPRAQGAPDSGGCGSPSRPLGVTWRTRTMVGLSKSGGSSLTEARLPPSTRPGAGLLKPGRVSPAVAAPEASPPWQQRMVPQGAERA